MNTRDEHLHGRAPMPVHVGEGVDLGTRLQEQSRDLYRVRRCALMEAFVSVGRDIMHECAYERLGRCHRPVHSSIGIDNNGYRRRNSMTRAAYSPFGNSRARSLAFNTLISYL